MAAQGGANNEVDLLVAEGRRQNLGFVVTFDWYTPRPHFVIVPRFSEFGFHPTTPLPVYGDDFLKNLLLAAESTVNVLANSPKLVTFSVHRGQWISGREFHAHVCVDSATYLDKYHRHLDLIRNRKPGWPEGYQTGQWERGRTYEQCVVGYPPARKNYFGDEVKTISTGGGVDFSFSPLNRVELTRVVFHPTLARIGFRGSAGAAANCIDAKLNLLKEMEQFATNRRLAASEADSRLGKDNGGCHLCLSFGGGNHSVEVILSAFECITAY